MLLFDSKKRNMSEISLEKEGVQSYTEDRSTKVSAVPSHGSPSACYPEFETERRPASDTSPHSMPYTSSPPRPNETDDEDSGIISDGSSSEGAIESAYSRPSPSAAAREGFQQVLCDGKKQTNVDANSHSDNNEDTAYGKISEGKKDVFLQDSSSCFPSLNVVYERSNRAVEELEKFRSDSGHESLQCDLQINKKLLEEVRQELERISSMHKDIDFQCHSIGDHLAASQKDTTRSLSSNCSKVTAAVASNNEEEEEVTTFPAATGGASHAPANGSTEPSRVTVIAVSSEGNYTHQKEQRIAVEQPPKSFERLSASAESEMIRPNKSKRGVVCNSSSATARKIALKRACKSSHLIQSKSDCTPCDELMTGSFREPLRGPSASGDGGSDGRKSRLSNGHSLPHRRKGISRHSPIVTGRCSTFNPYPAANSNDCNNKSTTSMLQITRQQSSPSDVANPCVVPRTSLDEAAPVRPLRQYKKKLKAVSSAPVLLYGDRRLPKVPPSFIVSRDRMRQQNSKPPAANYKLPTGSQFDPTTLHKKADAKYTGESVSRSDFDKRKHGVHGRPVVNRHLNRQDVGRVTRKRFQANYSTIANNRQCNLQENCNKTTKLVRGNRITSVSNANL